jgi:hypothetical protein
MIKLTPTQRELLSQVSEHFQPMEGKDRALWPLKEKGLVESRQVPLATPKQNGTNVVTEWRITPKGIRVVEAPRS